MKNTTNNENRGYIISVRNELLAYYEGKMYTCPECGEKVYISDDNTKCTCCDSDINIDDCEQLSLWDYIVNESLDIVYYIGSDKKTVQGVRICIACGGPNVYIDTYRKTIELYWWTEEESIYLDSEICEEFNNIFEDCMI